jgi:putative glutathione S-transferase
LKGLEEIIPVSVVHYEMLEKGWRFVQEGETVNGATKDHLYGLSHLRDLYFKADKEYDQRFTVPVLWDKKQETIVNNESSEIMRIFNSAFNDLLEGDKKSLNLLPEGLVKDVDEVNSWVYDGINNGVYKTGFATTQDAYESNLIALFDALNRVEAMLSESKGPYLLGDQLTEADIRLFVTIVRFDPVYVQHFKCNLGTIRHNYNHINKWLKNLYWNNQAFKQTTEFEHIKKHYNLSHKQISPYSIYVLGPLPHVEPEDDGEVILKIGNVTLSHLNPSGEGAGKKHVLKHQEPSA